MARRKTLQEMEQEFIAKKEASINRLVERRDRARTKLNDKKARATVLNASIEADEAAIDQMTAEIADALGGAE